MSFPTEIWCLIMTNLSTNYRYVRTVSKNFNDYFVLSIKSVMIVSANQNINNVYRNILRSTLKDVIPEKISIIPEKADISCYTNIKRLYINNVNEYINFYKLRNLKCLYTFNFNIDETRLCELSKLRNLYVNNDNKITGNTLKLLNLRSVCLLDCPAFDTGKLCSLSLTTLMLQNAAVPVNGLNHLTKLHLLDNPDFTGDCLKYLPKLQNVLLNNIPAFKSENLNKLSLLRKLYIFDTPFTDKNLSLDHLRKLVWLSKYVGEPFTGEMKCPKITGVVLSGSKVLENFRIVKFNSIKMSDITINYKNFSVRLRLTKSSKLKRCSAESLCDRVLIMPKYIHITESIKGVYGYK